MIIQQKLEILQNLLKSSLNRPEDFKITMEERPKEILFFIHANEKDIGLIIGRKGSKINALRQMFKFIFILDFPRKEIFTDIWECAESSEEVKGTIKND